MDLDSVLGSAGRLRLAHLPTPLERMARLTEHLGGPQLWVKRDDLTGLGLGGNKVRKLEFVLPDALERGADVLVTAGVEQSNSVRQIAAAAAVVGLDCHVIRLTDRVAATPASKVPTGNAFLTQLFGATVREVRWTGDRAAAIVGAAEDLAAAGRRPYVVPYGVSNPMGALGYVAAALELADQLETAGITASAVIHASGSGGTQAGLVVGFAASGVEVIGVDVDAEPDRIRAEVSSIAVQLANDLELDGRGIDASIEIAGGFAGPAYGSITDSALEAIDLAARFEGLVLDPVYSAKAFGAMIAMVRGGRFSRHQHVVFVHTGGAPSLLAMPDILGRIVPMRRPQSAGSDG